MKKLCILLAGLLSLSLLCGCEAKEKDDRISVVALNFAAYDFCRAVVGEAAELSMLLDPGTDAHSFEPSPEDIAAINECDIFVITGGESDSWTEKVLASSENEDRLVISMMEHSRLLCEGEEHHSDDHAHGHDHPDEHVWMAPDNAVSIIDAVYTAVCERDKGNAELYRLRAEEYKSEIMSEAEKTKKVIKDSGFSSIVIADRFPLKYFCDYYSLSYTAAFDACDVFADADARTVLTLIDAVRRDRLPTVYYIAGGSGYVADTVCRETGAEKLSLDALHTVTRDAFLGGVTYVDVMKFNREQLERGLVRAAD